MIKSLNSKQASDALFDLSLSSATSDTATSESETEATQSESKKSTKKKLELNKATSSQSTSPVKKKVELATELLEHFSQSPLSSHNFDFNSESSISLDMQEEEEKDQYENFCEKTLVEKKESYEVIVRNPTQKLLVKMSEVC